mgnify:FL=1
MVTKGLKMKKIFYGFFWSDLYYNTKNGIKSLIIYFPIVWNMRDWDYCHLLQMQKFQIKRLYNYIKKREMEVAETRIPKEKDMERCIEILNNLIEDNYIDKLGGLNSYKYPFKFKKINNKDKEKLTVEYEMIEEEKNDIYEKVNFGTEKEQEEDSEKIKKAHKLEEEEWKELWDIIKNGKNSDFGMQGWWD